MNICTVVEISLLLYPAVSLCILTGIEDNNRKRKIRKDVMNRVRNGEKLGK